jgi:LysR family hydrogen peroxide-inducible transcriptional activator
VTTLRQLHYLVALAETRHFARAAELCHVTQPALSTQLRELEASLGLTLIERRRGASEFTEEGQEILRRAGAIVAAVRDLEGFARQRRGTLVGPLSVGIIPSVAPYLLPLCLAELQQRFPRLEPKLRETQTDTLLAELTAGQIDVAIMALPVGRAGLRSRTLFRDRFVLALSSDKAASLRGRVTPDTLRTDELLLLEEGHCLRDQALTYCGAISRDRLSTFGATSLTTMLQMVGAGYGVTLLPEIVVRAGLNDPRVAIRRFAVPEPHRDIALVWRATSPRERDYAALARVIAACLGRDTGALASTGRIAPSPGSRRRAGRAAA